MVKHKDKNTNNNILQNGKEVNAQHIPSYMLLILMFIILISTTVKTVKQQSKSAIKKGDIAQTHEILGHLHLQNR